MLVKRSSNLGTDGTVTKAMVAIIKRIAHVCSKSFLSFFWGGTKFSVKCLFYCQSWLVKPFREKKLLENNLKKIMPRGLNVEYCVWNSVLLYPYHWIWTDCNKELIHGKFFWHRLLLLLFSLLALLLLLLLLYCFYYYYIRDHISILIIIIFTLV